MAAAQEAQKKLNDKLKIKDNVITYSAAVSACAKGSQPEEALQLLREMRLDVSMGTRDLYKNHQAKALPKLESLALWGPDERQWSHNSA